MKTVRILESRSGDRYSYSKGQIVELPDERAAAFVKRGIAVYAEAPNKPAENATSHKAAKAEKR